MPLRDARRLPLATYRLQLQAEFTFNDTAKQIDYFHSLGISDLYFSPIFRAAPGSTHGYDVADYRKINPELGGGEAFFRLTDALQPRGMSVLLDFVPNHMGIQGPFNAWWRDVLECGPYSPYANFFDIHWNTDRDMLSQRVLVPILESHYGEVLEQGKLTLSYADGAFTLNYADLKFPTSPDSYPLILAKILQLDGMPKKTHAGLEKIVDAFSNLPFEEGDNDLAKATARSQQIEQLKRQLKEFVDTTPELRQLIDAQLVEINGKVGDPQSFDELDRIIDHQHYRLARWKAGVHEINYRRFFAVDSLVGLRMETPNVFHESHLLLRHLLREGRVKGLRIDHIDGLWDPEQYLQNVQGLMADENKPETPNETKPLYVLVEKILERNEELPAQWAVHGTTGYEFIAQLAGIFVDPSNEHRFTKLYRKYTGDLSNYDDTVYAKKRLILDEMFANAVTNFGTELSDLVNRDRRWRDLTRFELITAVREIMACLHVYRTYRRGDSMSAEDRRIVSEAVRRAKDRNPRFDPQPFEFVGTLLRGEYPPADADEDYRQRLWRWVLSFQQYTGAIMAKSLEDTAFYTYCRFIALNEVGGDPSVFGGTVAQFHETNKRRLAHTPESMVTTSTHDTKMSEDVRARLYTLSELPAECEDWFGEWRQIATPYRTPIDETTAPSPVDEYRIYQILLGVWPLEVTEPTDELRKRLREHVRKAVNEAKEFTSWIHPNEAYLNGCDKFLDSLLSRPTGDAFLASFIPRAQRIAHLGMVNSLSQVVLKATVPGVPDFYQGCDLWDFSLVDPDNRRPVDYAVRSKLLEEVQTRTPLELLRKWTDGGIKLWLTQKLLQLRARYPEVFQSGDYVELSCSGRFQSHVVSFRRSHGGVSIVVIVPRTSALLGCPPTGLVWDNTRIELGAATGEWRDAFTGRSYAPTTSLALIDVLEELPAAVLVNQQPNG
jgi:(1->4)-alpha-D-glucan 1-alpha-D-glucosylmutase